VLPVVEHALVGHLPRQDPEVVDPPLRLGVEARAGWVVLEVEVGLLWRFCGGGGGGRGGLC
jgi:hypothetical protein